MTYLLPNGYRSLDDVVVGTLPYFYLVLMLRNVCLNQAKFYGFGMNESKGIAGTFLELFTFASSVELILLLFTSDFARS